MGGAAPGFLFFVFSPFFRELSQLSGESESVEQGLCSSVSILTPVGWDVLIPTFHPELFPTNYRVFFWDLIVLQQIASNLRLIKYNK